MKLFNPLLVITTAMLLSTQAFAGGLSDNDMKIFRTSFMSSCTQSIQSSKNGKNFSKQKITNYCSCSAEKAGNALTTEEIQYRQKTGKNSEAYINQVKASAQKCLKELIN